MKTKLLIVLLFLLKFQNSFSQYEPMLTNPSWIVASGSTYFSIPEGINTIIGAFTYKKFTFGSSELLLREDIATKRVYKRVGNADVLMFDFSLNVGDHIMLDGHDYVVYTITNVNVIGGTRKLYSLLWLIQNVVIGAEYWLESVGNHGHPLRAFYELPSDPIYSIACSYQNGINVYNSGLANLGTITQCPNLANNEFEISNNKMQIIPNPCSISTTIQTATMLQDAEIVIYDILGKEIKSIKNCFGNEIKISCEQILNGIYLIKITQENKTISYGKLIVSK
jgi:hypothetical protein